MDFLTKLNSSNLFLDPLEQFAVGQFFIYDKETLPELKLLSDNCPFNIYKIIKNIWFTAKYLVEISYYTINDWLLAHLIAPVHIIILWCLIGMVIVSVFFFESFNDKTTETEMFVTTNKHYNFVKLINKNLFNIVNSILNANTSLRRKEYFSILYFLFLFILLANMFGLIPFTFTLTSSFIVTFFLAATHFIGINIIGVYKNGRKFLDLFLPSGVPLVIAPFLVVIEFISYIAKVFSLSIRLFANMMSGHALLKILIGFSWTMLSVTGGIFYGIAILPWIIVTLIMFLELLIAFLQAYVFVVLIAIYINDVVSHH